jgi:selenocysteine-specific elongation factor
MAAAEPANILRTLVEGAGPAGVTLARAAQWAGVSPARATMLLSATPARILGGRAAVSQAGFDEVVRALPVVLGRVAGGVPRERLPSLLPGAGAAVLDAALETLAQRGLVRAVGGMVHLRRPEHERDAARQEGAAAARLAEQLRRAGLSPPDVRVLAPDKESHRLVSRLIREGIAVRTVDVVQKRDVVFHRDAVETAKVRLLPHLSQPPGLLVGEAGAVLGISRKFCVPLLEHLDAIRFTRRIADRRMVAAPEPAALPR